MLQRSEEVLEFERIVRLPDAELDLAQAALALAAVFEPGLAVGSYLPALDRLADELRARLAGGTGDLREPATLVHLLAEDMRFRGNDADYEDPRNSFLNQVLERRLGIPISLSVLYIAVGSRAGLRLDGVGYPGHFLVRWTNADGASRYPDPVYLDPFHGGQMIDREDLVGGLVNAGLERARAEHFLSAVTKRQILSRMLNNLKASFARREQLVDVLRSVELLLVLNPWDLDEHRDRGLLALELGQPGVAVTELESYLRHRPDAPDAARVERRLGQALRQPPGGG